MDAYFLGSSAAIATALLWSANSLLFTAAGRRIGAISVNAFRIIIAILFLGAAHLVFFGTVVPAANSAQWFWMGVSGIVGLGIGDFALFAAFVAIGPRRSLLLMSLAPVCSALFGYWILGEVLGLWAIIGIAVTLFGVIIVVLEKENGPDPAGADRGIPDIEKGMVVDPEGGKGNAEALTVQQKISGINGRLKRDSNFYGSLLGAVGGASQGIGLVLSKYGMFHMADDPSIPLPSLSATLIRMIVGGLFIWVCVIAVGKLPEVIERTLADRKAMLLSSGGAFFGPFLGIWLSMVAITYIHVGIAQTLMSLMPVLIIPMVWILHGEKTNRLGILGAVVAVSGVAILFLL